MSRIGNNPINVPTEVSIQIETNKILVKGKLGELEQEYSGISLELNNNLLLIKRNSETKDNKSKHGLYRSLISNMVEGVSKGFTKELELVGVGYRANCQGQKLDLALGFSHNIIFEIASEVKVETISEKGKNPIVKLTSIDKQLLGYVAAKIRSFRKPEPYKGKGIRFIGEEIRRKAGKSA
jgi:large subunit ribosomal protein L6